MWVDALGRAVLRVDGGAFAAGRGHEIVLAGALPAGAYVYRLRAAYVGGGADEATGRLSVVR